MFPESKVTEIYCMADDFCKEFTLQQEKYMIKDMKTMHRNKPNRMSDAEIMVILILFHSGGFRCFKHYYKEYVCKHLKHLFPRQVSYNRFVELEKEVLLPMTIFIKRVLLGTCTGISFVDSTPLCVCRNQRILIHKTFEGLAERGRCSMGWFFGFKLHLIINDKGEILNFMFTPGNVDDREPLKQGRFLENIKGKLCADKGYIGQALFENLFLNGIQLVTKVKNNMRNSLMSIADKILLRKRALIETVNDELKNIAQIEHSRHRSFSNFIANSLSVIAAYCFFEKKPAIDVKFVNDGQLAYFLILFRTHVIYFYLIKKQCRIKRNIISFNTANYLLIMYLFRQAINHIHYLLAYFICRLHGCSLRIHTDNRFGITLTQMYPLVREIYFHTVYVVYLFILIQFLHLGQNSVHIRFRSQINAILGNEIGG